MRLTVRIECLKPPNYLSMDSLTSMKKVCDHDKHHEDYDLVNLWRNESIISSKTHKMVPGMSGYGNTMLES